MVHADMTKSSADVRSYVIRPVLPPEFPAIAELQIASWRSAYRGIVKDGWLDGAVFANRRDHWAETAKWTKWGFVLAAEREAEFLGFVACWEDKPSGFDVILDNLHVRPDAKGLGVGRALVGAAAARIAAAGLRSVYLHVFAANERAIAFYRSIGGVVDEEGFDDAFGETLPQLRFVWNDAAALARRCGQLAVERGA